MLDKVPEMLVQDLRSCEFVIFDNDGTLLNSLVFAYSAFIAGWNELDAKYNFGCKTPSKAQYRLLIGLPWFEFYTSILPEKFQHLYDEIHERISIFELQALRDGKGKLYDGIAEVLVVLRKRGYKIILVSNASNPYFDACVEMLHYNDYFDACYCVGETRLKKYELVKKAMQKFNLTKGVMIGDKITDIEAGIKNELLTIGCAYGYGTPDEIANADYIIHNPSELLFCF